MFVISCLPVLKGIVVLSRRVQRASLFAAKRRVALLGTNMVRSGLELVMRMNILSCRIC